MKINLRLSAIVFIPGLFTLGLFWSLVFQHFDNTINAQIANDVAEGTKKIELASLRISSEQSRLINEIRLLRNSARFDNYLKAKSPERKKQLENEWLNAITFNEEILQLRYIDFSGREQIRVSRTRLGEKPNIDTQLQDKKHRDYVQIGLNLPPGTILIPPADLNKEFGEIQQPLVPTIRTLYRLDYADNQSGIFVVNYSAQSVLNFIESISEQRLELINFKGYFINGENAFSWLLNNDKKPIIETNPQKWADLQNTPLNKITNHERRLTRKIMLFEDQRVEEQQAFYFNYELPSSQIEFKHIIYDFWFLVALISSIIFIAMLFFIYLTLSALEREAQIAREAEKKAKHALDVKTLFLANMSHEMRTPLNGILGFLELLIREPLTPIQLRYAQGGLDTTILLTQMINDILDLSKLEARKMRIHQAPFSLKQITSIIGDLMSANLQGKKLDIWFDIDENLATHYLGDQIRLTQILVNLTTNAIKFTHEGHVIVRISQIEKGINSSKIRFSVIDSGIGLSDEESKRIFDNFEQVDSSISKDYQGTGLGLSIVKQLLALMDSEIHVDSKLGVGSTFSFEIELIHSDDSNTFKENAVAVSEKFPNTQNLHFLLLGHSRVGAALLERMCHQLSWTSVTADTLSAATKEVLTSFDTKPFDVIMIDQDFAQANDDIVVTRLKQLYKNHNIPSFLMLLSLKTQLNDIHKKQELLVIDGYLLKPISSSVLLNTINKIVNKPTCEKLTTLPLTPMVKFGNLHILVVEDNLINQEIVTSMLQELGVTLSIAHNGQQAVDQLSLQGSCKYDLIFMDMQMPIMDGISATKLIRDIPYCKKVPIIALSANSDDSEKEECLQAGMNDFIAKPYTQLQLSAVIKQYAFIFKQD